MLWYWVKIKPQKGDLGPLTEKQFLLFVVVVVVVGLGSVVLL